MTESKEGQRFFPARCQFCKHVAVHAAVEYRCARRGCTEPGCTCNAWETRTLIEPEGSDATK